MPSAGRLPRGSPARRVPCRRHSRPGSVPSPGSLPPARSGRRYSADRRSSRSSAIPHRAADVTAHSRRLIGRAVTRESHGRQDCRSPARARRRPPSRIQDRQAWLHAARHPLPNGARPRHAHPGARGPKCWPAGHRPTPPWMPAPPRRFPVRRRSLPAAGPWVTSRQASRRSSRDWTRSAGPPGHAPRLTRAAAPRLGSPRRPRPPTQAPATPPP